MGRITRFTIYFICAYKARNLRQNVSIVSDLYIGVVAFLDQRNFSHHTKRFVRYNYAFRATNVVWFYVENKKWLVDGVTIRLVGFPWYVRNIVRLVGRTLNAYQGQELTCVGTLFRNFSNVQFVLNFTNKKILKLCLSKLTSLPSGAL